MAKAEKKIITINWQVLGSFLSAVLRFIKWPVTLIVITFLIVKISDYAHGVQINWDLILKYIDVIIWPAVVVGALWFIKPNLPNLLDRLEELNLLGNNAKFSKKQNQETENQADELKEIDPDAPKPTTKTNADFQVADDETHTLLSSYEAAVAYAQVYADIFGTQIDALRRLLDYSAGLKNDGFADILAEHQRRSKGKGYTDVVPFMQFLLRNTLALFDTKTQTYQLTNAGYYFLVYLYKAGLLERPKGW